MEMQRYSEATRKRTDMTSRRFHLTPEELYALERRARRERAS